MRQVIFLFLFVLVVGCVPTMLEPVVVERETATPTSKAIVEVQRSTDNTATPQSPMREATETAVSYPFSATEGSQTPPPIAPSAAEVEQLPAPYPGVPSENLPQRFPATATSTPAIMAPTDTPVAYVPPDERITPTPTASPTPIPLAPVFTGQLPTELVYEVDGKVWLLRQDLSRDLVSERVEHFAYHPQTGAMAYVPQTEEMPQSVYWRQDWQSEPELIYTMDEVIVYPWGNRRITSLAFSSDGTTLAIMLTESLLLYDRAAKQRRTVLTTEIDTTSDNRPNAQVYYAKYFAFNDQKLVGNIRFHEWEEPMVIDLQTGEITMTPPLCVECFHLYKGAIADTWWVEYYSAFTGIIEDDGRSRSRQTVSLLSPGAETADYQLELDPFLDVDIVVYNNKVYIWYVGPQKEETGLYSHQLWVWDPFTDELVILFEGDSRVRDGRLRITPDAEGNPHFFLEWFNRSYLLYFDLETQTLAALIPQTS